jgi:predicted ATPase/class 3 adenylate cyclase
MYWPGSLRDGDVMAQVPTGTVTLLFSDIEGSTRLLERLGDRYVQVLAEHQRQLRLAFARFNGREVDTEGDAFFIAFGKASEAVAAAVAAQQALAAHPWPDGGAVRVRMGIHTGEPMVVGQDYAGLDVHLAARICSAAHGGQVLLSQPTRELLGDDLPSGVGLRDLGEHRLKDLSRPQRLFQLVVAGLSADFPPLRAVGSRPTNLPAELTSFVGRQQEVGAIRGLLGRPDVRLLTLSGPGGSGKTRLAAKVAGELAASFPAGVVFVGLAPVNDPALVVPTIAQVVGARGTPGQSLLESLTEYVGDRRLLLVLDNFEQVIAAATSIVDLLRACPQLKILVTSRAALHVSGEHTYLVPPLSLPARGNGADHDVTVSEAMTLFVERARAVNPSFSVTHADAPLLAEICRRLDGLPLAIELAAARSRMLPPQAMLARLDRRLQLLTGGGRDLPARQQTLQGAIDWSHDLLEADEQTLFARVAVFAGGCALEAAEAVCNLEGDLDVLAGLDALVDKNLLQPRGGPDGDPRLLMLETIREYALARLTERNEADAVGREHAGYYTGLAERAEMELLGPRQEAWHERLDVDVDNFNAALGWSLAHQQVDITARLAGALLEFWLSRGRALEGLQWLGAALERRDSLTPPTLARALFAKAYLLLQTGAHHQQAIPLLEESLFLLRKLGDKTRTVWAVSVLGHAALRAGELHRSLMLREEAVALAREDADRWSMAMAMGNLGISLLAVEDQAGARSALEESLTLYGAVGEPAGIAFAHVGLAMLALSEADLERASSLLQEAFGLAWQAGALTDAARYLADLALVALHAGDYSPAGRMLKESLTLVDQVDDDLLVGQCLWATAVAAAATGQWTRAVRLWSAATAFQYRLAIPPFVVRPLEERLLEPARNQLTPEAARAEWVTGQAMRREEAISTVLER